MRDIKKADSLNGCVCMKKYLFLAAKNKNRVELENKKYEKKSKKIKMYILQDDRFNGR